MEDGNNNLEDLSNIVVLNEALKSGGGLSKKGTILAVILAVCSALPIIPTIIILLVIFVLF